MFKKFIIQNNNEQIKPQQNLSKRKMKFIDQLKQSVLQVRKKAYNLYEKIADEEEQCQKSERYSYRNIDAKNDMLRSTLKFSTYAPLIVYSYILLYGLYSFYTIIKVIILGPIQLILGIVNIMLSKLKLYKSRYSTMHSIVVMTVAYILSLNEDLFDISFMYHLIRGQSTVKVYAIIFALESSQIVLTKLGIFLYSNIKNKLTNKQIPFYKLLPEFLVQSLYVFIHSYVIYIDFLIYSVVLNSSLESFVIFWSAVYLTKMKNTPTFGIDINKYKVTLTEDSKYRLGRILFLVLFLCNQHWVSIPSLGYKFLFIVFVEEIFIIIKHLLYLLSSYRGASDTSALQIREEMYKTMYFDNQASSVDKCVMQNFTVLPFSVFVIKIFSVIIQSNWEPNFLAYFTFYVMLCMIAGVLIFLIILIKSAQKMAQKIRRKNEQTPSPFINSICIDVIGQIVETGKKKAVNINETTQKTKTHQLSNSKQQKQSQGPPLYPLRLHRTQSILDSLLLHADKIQQNKEEQQQQQQVTYLDPLQELDQITESGLINPPPTQRNSHLKLKKTRSHF